MSFLLDTNALSEITRPRPDPVFLRWLDGVDEDDLFISALTVGELRRGVCRLPQGRRRADIDTANERMLDEYADRILGLDAVVTDTWPRLSAGLADRGVVIGAIDELLVATAVAHDLTVVSRNARHFADSGCRLLSPWSTEGRD